MNQGKTLKQFARAEFFDALAEYKQALTTSVQDKRRFISASLRIHAVLGSEYVPKKWKRFLP